MKRLAAICLAFGLLTALLRAETYLSPTALAASVDGKTLFVACKTANQVVGLDIATRKVLFTITTPSNPTSLAPAVDGKTLFVTCAGAEGKVCGVDLGGRKVVDTISVGHTPSEAALAPDGKSLFVCNCFNDDVSVINVKSRKEIRRIPVRRQPLSSVVTKDGAFLLVANALPDGPTDGDHVASVISVIDIKTFGLVKEIELPNGSTALHNISLSPDGKYAVIPHILARFHLPATQVDRGWINANAATILDVQKLEVLNTVLLDSPESGAANPWAAAWSEDGAKLVITHAGSQELSVIDFSALLTKLARLSRTNDVNRSYESGSVAHFWGEVANDLAFLNDVRQRVSAGGIGPRSIACVGNRAYVGNYFSDDLSALDLTDPSKGPQTISLGSKTEPNMVRKGEINFHDARLCFQTWQSCSSCHPGDGRNDGINWDLPNDGVGNPKNTKSLLLAHKTPPSMSLGVRDSAETAVRAGLKFVLFSQQPESVAAAIDEYLKSLQPVPSPRLVNGILSEKAKRGARIFIRAGCSECHPPGLFTDLQTYDVGTRSRFDRAGDRFDTPTLVELWRTPPYLHDGSAATVRDVVTTHNPNDQHGKTSDLSSDQIEELCEYVLSL